MNDYIHDELRRRFLRAAGGLGTALALTPDTALAEGSARLRKAIPSSKELLPVIGMGSSRTFDVGGDALEREPLLQVLRAFFAHGGGLIDSSPMYGNAESVLGELLARLPVPESLFAATKVWTDGRRQGVEQMRRSSRRMGVPVFDLMQIHNLRDWRVHLDTLRAWKAEGRVRYIGITTSHGRFHPELADILTRESFDFVQFSYNIEDRAVERRLLPLAADRGVAVLVNRPFQRGELFSRVRGRALPAWAAEFDCRSWGQFFLKFVISHPAVTCAIPATSEPKHMVDNMGAGVGRVPEPAMRRRMVEYLRSV